MSAENIKEELWNGCIAGVLRDTEYANKLTGAGVEQIKIEPTRIYGVQDARLPANGVSTAAFDFQSIHDRFRPLVLRYLSRLVGENEAEDLTQSVMLKVSEGLREFRGDSSVSTWIYRIATNAALDKLRGKSVQILSNTELESDEDDVALAAQSASVETTAIREEMNGCIREFIERLPETHKKVMVLSELEGFKNAEIATILGISLDTVKIRLHRAREKLRKELDTGCHFYRDECDELACDRKQTAAFKFRPRN